MPKIDNQTAMRWRAMIDAFLDAKHILVDGTAITRSDVKLGRDAWTIASMSGITREAYADRTIVDAHIQTFLESAFPYAVFRDRKVY